LFIPDPDLDFLPIQDPGSRGQKDSGSRIQNTAYKDRLKELGLTTLEERRHQADMVQTYKIVTGKGGMVNSKTMVYISDRIRKANSRSAADPLHLSPQASRAGDQKTIFLTKSGREPEQDPCQCKASKECYECLKNGCRTLRDTTVVNT
jgi:hypothetical protein